MTLGTKLQNLRKQAAMSQEALAGQLGVSRQAVSRWELDISLPETENIIKLAKIFNVSFDYLLGAGEIQQPEQTKNRNIYHIIIFAVCMIVVLTMGRIMLSLLQYLISALAFFSREEIRIQILITGLIFVACIWVAGVAIIIARYFYKKDKNQ